MSVVYATALKQARLQAVVDAIDAGSGPGVLQIGTTGMGTVLASITLGDPSGTPSGGTLTFDMPKSDTSADNTGTAAAARIRDSDGNDIVTGLTVGTSGTDIVLDTTTIVAGQTVTINSATITHG